VLTSVESDHQDYYPHYEDIRAAFLEYLRKLPPEGFLLYCADDRGAAETAEILRSERPELRIIPYGFTASGDFKIENYSVEQERSCFTLAGFPARLKLRIPGRHMVLDAAAALALTSLLVEKESGGWNEGQRGRVVEALENFNGSRRRSEIIGEAGGILFMDDYGHHPTAIKATLAGLKEFYPGRRLIVSFMSHTYSRTAALLDAFALSLFPADIIFLHKIYASAREAYSGGITGRSLFQRCGELLGSGSAERLHYFEEPLDAVTELEDLLKPGDIFLTMGAGDNWRLGRKIFDHYRQVRTEIPRV
jgi:UDP-N-acetylmuramate--alanine ligase